MIDEKKRKIKSTTQINSIDELYEHLLVSEFFIAFIAAFIVSIKMNLKTKSLLSFFSSNFKLDHVSKSNDVCLEKKER